MNKEIIKECFPMYRFMGESHEIVVEDVGVKKTASDELLDCIYAPDEFTGLPTCEVALYLSPKVDPMIREFIAQNLLQPNPNTGGYPDEQADLLHDLVRGVDESVSDYAVRVRGIIENDNAIRQKESELNNQVIE